MINHQIGQINRKSILINHKIGQINHKSILINHENVRIHRKPFLINHKNLKINNKKKRINHKNFIKNRSQRNLNITCNPLTLPMGEATKNGPGPEGHHQSASLPNGHLGGHQKTIDLLRNHHFGPQVGSITDHSRYLSKTGRQVALRILSYLDPCSQRIN